MSSNLVKVLFAAVAPEASGGRFGDDGVVVLYRGEARYYPSPSHLLASFLPRASSRRRILPDWPIFAGLTPALVFGSLAAGALSGAAAFALGL